MSNKKSDLAAVRISWELKRNNFFSVLKNEEKILQGQFSILDDLVGYTKEYQQRIHGLNKTGNKLDHSALLSRCSTLGMLDQVEKLSVFQKKVIEEQQEKVFLARQAYLTAKLELDNLDKLILKRKLAIENSIHKQQEKVQQDDFLTRFY